MSEFGKNLKLARKSAGILPKYLAFRISVSTQQCWRYESGRSEPSHKTLLKICDLLSVTPNDLFGISPQDKPNE